MVVKLQVKIQLNIKIYLYKQLFKSANLISPSNGNRSCALNVKTIKLLLLFLLFIVLNLQPQLGLTFEWEIKSADLNSCLNIHVVFT